MKPCESSILDITYTPETSESDDESESDIKTATIRFVPEDSGTSRAFSICGWVCNKVIFSVSHIYQVMNECQELNPEPEENMSG